jgi:hypothetical protein
MHKGRDSRRPCDSERLRPSSPLVPHFTPDEVREAGHMVHMKMGERDRADGRISEMIAAQPA